MGMKTGDTFKKIAEAFGPTSQPPEDSWDVEVTSGSPWRKKATGSTKARAVDPLVFLEEVQAALFGKLDQAFPEFKWERDKRGWVAKDSKFTKDRFSARADRVVCHEPFGFYVHGGSPTPWMSYLNGGSPPRGAKFFEVLKELAALAGVDASVLDRELTAEEEKRHEEETRRRSLFEVFLEHAQEDLVGAAGKPGRAYLVKKRGHEEAGLVELGFGFFTTKAEVQDRLKKAGFTEEEIDASGLVADGRWEGRIVSPCRDWRGHIQGFWARDITGQAEEGAKYLKNRGFTEKSVVAYGLDEALRHEAGRKNLVLVEGFLDVSTLRAKGFPNVAALGSTGKSLTGERWKLWPSLGSRPLPSSWTMIPSRTGSGRAGREPWPRWIISRTPSKLQRFGSWTRRSWGPPRTRTSLSDRRGSRPSRTSWAGGSPGTSSGAWPFSKE